MHKEEQTDVLVVGAGPTGLITALCLAEAGIEVMIIDHEWRRTSRSYACALHPRSLALLDKLGLASKLIERGRRVDTLAFYTGGSRRAELKLGQLAEDYPFLLLLPQSELEGEFEGELRRKDHVKVRWNHRLSSLLEGQTKVLASVDKLVETATGYIVPTWDWVVGKTFQTQAAFLVGADGHSSYVRRALGIEYVSGQGGELYEVFEFTCQHPIGHEAVVVLDTHSTNVLWPLADNRCRWSFQVPQAPPGEEFPAKDRSSITVVHPADEDTRMQHLLDLLEKRAPWFKLGVEEITWSGVVPFEHRLVKRLGHGRCWLVGDSAHQTGPVGIQSMNVGMLEAADLAGRLERILRDGESADLLEDYDRERRAEWARLLGLSGGLQPGPSADAWVKAHCAQILPCLPGSGPDLERLAAQLGLVWRANAV